MAIGTRLKDKVIVVTGSTSGIGAGIARICAGEGAHVVVTGRREEKGKRVVDEIQAQGGSASFHVLDVTHAESIQALMDDTAKTFGRLDGLANNAANVGLKDGTVDELTVEMWDAIMDSDLRGAFLAIKYALPHMRAQGGGSIVNTGSIASCAGDLGSAAYASAKAGVNLLTQSVAVQYGRENIRCNCVRPGLIVTPDNADLVPDLVKEIFTDNILVNRYGSPEDIAWLVCYLLSDESGYVTGQIMNVDGGIFAHAPTVGQFRKANSRTW